MVATKSHHVLKAHRVANLTAGSEQAPKSICKDKIIGTRKGTGVGNNGVDEE